ncbi:NUDIX domain-containing protein [Streptomyces sp. M19]
MGLAAERLLGLLVEQDHLAARVRQFGGGRQSGEPRPDHDHVRVVRHVSVLVTGWLGLCRCDPAYRPVRRQPPCRHPPSRPDLFVWRHARGSRTTVGRRAAGHRGRTGPGGGPARRADATALRLRHRCVFVLARDAGAASSSTGAPPEAGLPSLYDMFVGGVVGAGESYDEAALREAEEELGVSGLPAPEPLFTFLYESPEHTWFSRVYEVRCELPVRPQVEEMAWYDFLPEEELRRRIPEWEWVPDGAEAYRRLREWRGE